MDKSRRISEDVDYLKQCRIQEVFSVFVEHVVFIFRAEAEICQAWVVLDQVQDFLFAEDDVVDVVFDAQILTSWGRKSLSVSGHRFHFQYVKFREVFDDCRQEVDSVVLNRNVLQIWGAAT